MQRLCIRPVDNEVGISGKELHCFVREVLAPVPMPGLLASETTRSRIAASTRSAVSSLLSFRM